MTSRPISTVDASGRALKILLTRAQTPVVANQLGVPEDSIRAKMYSAGEPGLYYYDAPLN